MSVINQIDRDLFIGNPPDNDELARRLNRFSEQLRTTLDGLITEVDALTVRIAALESSAGLTTGTVYVLNVDNETVELQLVKGKVKTAVVV